MTSDSIAHFLQRLEALRIRIQVEGEQLRLTAPPGTITPELRGEISSRKAGLLSFLANRDQSLPGADAALPKVDRSKPLPASYSQKSLWLFQQLHPDSAAYNIPGTLRLRGPLDVEILARSLTEIVRRHEALRTTFASHDGDPVQVINAPALIELPTVDLSDTPASERMKALQDQLNAVAGQPFDLADGPLFRPRLWKLDTGDHALQLNVHHIVFDGWSLQILLTELMKLYAAGGSADAAGLVGPELQFVDFAAWEHQWILSPGATGHAAFWENSLAGAPGLLELPTDRPRAVHSSHRGGHLRRILPATLVAALHATRRNEKTTLFILLFAAFKVLLYRYSKQTDLVVGTPVANRTREAFESIVGFFVNVLPIRTALAPQTSFRDLLRAVQRTTLDAFAHQEMPFDLIVGQVNPPRSPSYSPVFQVLFTHQNTRGAAMHAPGLSLERLPSESAAAKYDLSVFVTEAAEGITMDAEFSSDLFDAPTITRWLANFEQLLQSITRDPEQAIAALPLLTSAERHQVLEGWNETAAAAPGNANVPQLFEAQVERTPDAIAVVTSDRRTTFSELNRRANQLAHHLRKRGVGPEVLVAVCLPRTIDLIVALCGIHKAGGAYVPLDPHHPPERLAYILEHARAGVIVTDAEFQAMLVTHAPGSGALAYVCLDQDAEHIAQESAANPPPTAQPENLSHVIYTSGSTGRPKGVAIEHHNVTALMHWAHRVYPLSERKGLLAGTSVCFDLSVFELFTPLCWGGTIHLAAHALELPAWPAAHEITLVNTVPSAMAELLRVGGIPDSVTVVNLAGEPLSRELVDQLYARPHIRKVYDLYGPTEDTVYSTCALRQAGAPATIGRPLDHKRAYLLDAQRQPVPIGVPGEIYLGGAGVARGYLHRADLTTERFLPDPFSARANARMYRTGDLARYREDGQIDFLGRMDHQVKIRGFRIELGEIEAVLREHPGIVEAVVTTWDDRQGERRLVAYAQVRPDRRPGVDELRTHLQSKVPDYMVPPAIMLLEQLPLTPNGKVDRKALPPPEIVDSEGGHGWLAPRTPNEELVAEIWRSILQLPRLSVHDSFFDSGGHSLLAMRAVSRLTQACGFNVPLRVMFDHPTVAGTAEAITGLALLYSSGHAESSTGEVGMEQGTL